MNCSRPRWWQMTRKQLANGLRQLAVNTMLLVLGALLLVGGLLMLPAGRASATTEVEKLVAAPAGADGSPLAWASPHRFVGTLALGEGITDFAGNPLAPVTFSFQTLSADESAIYYFDGAALKVTRFPKLATREVYRDFMQTLALTFGLNWYQL